MDSKKKYLLSGEPVTASRLIREASAISPKFDADWLKSTAVAASILREYGHDVENNPEFQK